MKYRKFIKGGSTSKRLKSEIVIVHKNEFVLPRGVPPTKNQVREVKRRGGLYKKSF